MIDSSAGTECWTTSFISATYAISCVSGDIRKRYNDRVKQKRAFPNNQTAVVVNIPVR